MGEAALTFVITETLKKAISLGAQEVSLSWKFQRELTRLRESLLMIQAVLRDAEQRQVREEAVRLWLKKLKDIAYDADDVLDELAYEILRRKVELQNRMTKKVRNFFSLSNPIAFRFKMTHKVKNINESLDKIKNEASGFGLSLGSVDTTPQFSHNRETDSFVDDSKVVGRENDVSKIVEILINSGNQEVLSVIPIVGMAGLGKTTIAQSVYRDDEIERHFDAKIWVCVSENFEAKSILRECLESLISEKGGMENMNAILEKLRKELEGKRYLLVLDDVWNKEFEKWDSLKSRLLQISTTRGNGIIVSTRSDEVASIMETLPRYHLGKLSDDDCWSVFKDRAFENGGAPMTPDLERIGREIVKKCAGVPLAAKVLGGMMRSKKEKEEWLSIQNNKIWDLPEEENGILPALKLSFDHLPSPSLKHCFAYCSMFSKDFVIEKNNLIQLWMAQGLLQPSQGSNLEMEDLGNKYFNILLMNSLFQDARKDMYDDIIDCKMHDLVHDLAQSISRVESFTLKPNEVNDELGIRHLSLISTGEILPTIRKESAGRVRTLFSKGNVLGNMLSNFKGLRVLHLDGALVQELPMSIGNLKHLRYLAIPSRKIKAIPKSIAKLYNLQTLIFNFDGQIEELPNGVKNLISLRHFCIGYSPNMKMPVGMGRLTCLQTLPYFIVGRKRGRRIEELGCLNKLRGKLRIHNLENVKDREEAKKANLLGKTNIYKLSFNWNGGITEGNYNNDEDVLEGLQPHPNLKSLSISNFGGDKFPSWVMTMRVNTNGSSSLMPLDNLVEIKLSCCNKCEQIPMLGHLPFLKVLEIGGMGPVKCIGTEFYGHSNDGTSGSSNGGSVTKALFPALKIFRLSIYHLEKWMEAARVVFPCLEELYLWNCSQLRTAPSHFSSLRELEIKYVNSSMPLANISSNLTALTSLTLEEVSELIFLPKGLLQNNQNLAHLNIWKCPALTYITPHVSGCCTSLRSLDIFECEKLSYLPDGLHTLASLEVLSISNCPNLESIPSIHGLTSFRKLEILYCDGLTILPSGLESCTSLEDLTLARCPNLISVVEDFREFHSLSSLTIIDCGKMKCLPEGIHCLTRLKSLGIGGFLEELDSFPNFEDILQLHLRDLTLCGWPKLKFLPDQLQHLTALTSLYMLDFDGVEALPEWLGNLSSLKKLCIRNCENLMYLPTVESMRRLTKLEELRINKCPLLKERCAKGSGPEYFKISHIPNIRIDWIFYGFGRGEEVNWGRRSKMKWCRTEFRTYLHFPVYVISLMIMHKFYIKRGKKKKKRNDPA